MNSFFTFVLLVSVLISIAGVLLSSYRGVTVIYVWQLSRCNSLNYWLKAVCRVHNLHCLRAVSGGRFFRLHQILLTENIWSQKVLIFKNIVISLLFINQPQTIWFWNSRKQIIFQIIGSKLNTKIRFKTTPTTQFYFSKGSRHTRKQWYIM